MSHIFISYSRQDQAYVTLLAQALESHRLPLWLDDRIDYGTTWPRVIQDQLEQCTVFLLVMSPRSENSHWVQCELSMALELKKPIFPLLLEGRRWLAVAALHEVNVVEGKLPPANFFDRLRPYFPPSVSTADSITLQDVVTDTLPSRGEIPTLKSSTPQTQTQADDLSSEKGIDYTPLRDLLKAQDWRAADRETYETMIRAVGKKSDDWFTSDELLNFPCADLRTIDRLWVKYSQGKFGFSVQKQIYVECGAKLDGNYPGDKVWHEFCDRVGWRKYDPLIFDFSLSPTGGEFPAFGVLGLVGWGGVVVWHGWLEWFWFLFSRTETCEE
jgi:hypothetical protein